MFYKFCSLIIAICIALGFWQVQRLEQKKQLIRQFDANLNSYIETTDLSKINKQDYYKKLSLNGEFLMQPIYYYSQNNYEILLPFKVDGNFILVNLGTITEKNNAILLAISDRKHVSGYIIPFPESKALGINNDLKNNIWFYLNAKELYKFYKIDKFILGIIIPDSKGQFIGKEVQVREKVKFRNDHLGYAIIWFSLAFISIIMMLFHYRKTKIREK